MQEKAISKGADRCDTGLCDSWHGDHAAHRGERRLCLSRPLSPVLPYQQRRVCESVSVKGEDRKNTKLSFLKGLISASHCHRALWNTWMYRERMWIVIYIFKACLFMQTTAWPGFKSYPKWRGIKPTRKWKGRSSEVMSYWEWYNPFKEFNYKHYWALNTVAAVKAYNTRFQTSSGGAGQQRALYLRAVTSDAGAECPVPAVPPMDATFQVNSLLLPAWICLLVIQQFSTSAFQLPRS